MNGKPAFFDAGDKSSVAVPIRPYWGNTSHPYLQKMFFKPMKEKEGGDGIKTGTVPQPDVKKVEYEWQIDNDSPIVLVPNPKIVKILLSSPKLNADYSGNGAVAMTFGVSNTGPFDPTEIRDLRKMTGGRVLYVLSHFSKLKPGDDELTLHNMLLNFLLEASERAQLKKK